MSDRNPPPNFRQLFIILGIFLIIIILIIQLISFLVDWGITYIPVSWEQKLGSIVVPIYEEKSEDSPQQQVLNQLLDRLESQIDDESIAKRDYRVIYIPEDTVNAFAIPGDVIGVFQGLVEKVNSENELMMILGHELGHFSHRDHLRGLGKALIIQIAIATVAGDNTLLSNSIGTITETISNSHYSRSQEYQADEYGLMLLNKTYGHVVGATDFFKHLDQKKALNWDFFSTHPASKKRVKRLNQLIEQQQYKIGSYSKLDPRLVNN
ncbi:M48 family metallopeptidase [Crocosphaera chwakensis]|uniref:Putative Zn-dependent protease, contains TPR repeats n=1 Tax=Crocosphaera chwakensis CCY0110 TaxID=391612 RepID=A3IKA4_9CHRO|nr:M48 family metallopeptidase [Crocosphaera chwakensis]EAZ93093.1 putative Zn-dependent protease, contains TPR repeats [Crocosphaera chwakensis CCY0110]